MKDDIQEVVRWLHRNQFVRAEIKTILPKSRGYTPDGVLLLRFKNGREITVQFDLKVSVAPRNIETIVSRKLHHDVSLIAAEYITPKAKDQLLKLGIGFVDREGNFFYQDDRGTFIFIEHVRGATHESERSKIPNAFSKKGLYLTYRFLKDNDLLNSRYESIKKETSISLNTISRVIGSLNKEGFLDSGDSQIFFIESEIEALKQVWIKHHDRQLKDGGSIKDDPELIRKLKDARKELAI